MAKLGKYTTAVKPVAVGDPYGTKGGNGGGSKPVPEGRPARGPKDTYVGTAPKIKT